MSRRVRRLIDVSKKKQGYVSQRDMDGAAHRLSKPSDKFSANRAVPAEKPEPYCVVYFRNNPEAVDVRPPTDKLQDLFDKLDEDLEPSVKFTTLIQIKSAQYMLHGENSVEALRAHAQLGFFYNENLRPQSALRHLEKAHMLERTNTIEAEETIEIAVETAQAHISLRNDKKNNTTRHVSQAEDVLRPYYDTEISDLHLKYKRDLVKARIFSAKKKYDDALDLYETALETLQEENEGDETPEEAKLYVEMAETAELQNYRKRSGQYYKKAYEIFQNLGMEESAKNIEEKLPADDEYEEDAEEDNTSGNNNMSEDGEYRPHPPSEGGSSDYAINEPPPKYGDEEDYGAEEDDEGHFQVQEPPPRNLDEHQENIIGGLLGDDTGEKKSDNEEEDKDESAEPATLNFDMKDELSQIHKNKEEEDGNESEGNSKENNNEEEDNKDDENKEEEGENKDDDENKDNDENNEDKEKKEEADLGTNLTDRILTMTENPPKEES